MSNAPDWVDRRRKNDTDGDRPGWSQRESIGQGGARISEAQGSETLA